MRAREERLVVTFSTTSGAMAAEKVFKQNQIPGRLIPVPRQITAGCGLAWSSPPQEQEQVSRCMEQSVLAWDTMGLYLI